MDTLREKSEIKGVSVKCFKQNETNILCKINLTPRDAISLCDRTKSGLFRNKEFHERLVNMLVSQLDELLK